jgi:putative methionine-R-sulfoxide reductase with GAF domain
VVDVQGHLIAVFDVDSEAQAAFDSVDAEWLERILQDTFAN